MSKKKWGKTAVKTERIIRDAVPKPETTAEIDKYLTKVRSVTAYELANKFGIRLSLARQILRQKERDNLLVPYLREGGLVAYTTPAEMQADRQERRIRISEVLEEVASSAAPSSIITEEMDLALAAASVESMKPSKLARQRREFGEKKERAKARRPEVVVEPLEEETKISVPSPHVEAPPVTPSAPKESTDDTSMRDIAGSRPASTTATEPVSSAETAPAEKSKPARRTASKKSEESTTDTSG